MFKKIENAASCEIRAVIKFLNARNVRPCDIHRQLKEVYGDNVMDESSVRRWCRNFNLGRGNTHDDERSGRPSVITDQLLSSVNEFVRNDRRVTIDEISEHFPNVSRTIIHELVKHHLHYAKICARWVPRMLTDEHKNKRMAAALTFLERYSVEGDSFLTRIVTGDETWICYASPESKRQSMEWHHAQSPNKPKKFKTVLSTRKLMATIFWDWRGVLLIDFMPRGDTINANAYCETLKKLRRAIQNRRRGLLSNGVILVHDNARPHAAGLTQQLLQQFKWETFNHPPYSPDLAPSDFHLFTKLKDFLAGKKFDSDEELKEGVTTYLNTLAAAEYEAGIQKLVTRYDKCLNLLGDYVEK